MSADANTCQSNVSSGTERRLNMIEAINEALDVSMQRDDDVVVMGEDVGYFGGVFRCTAGLQEKYGKTRVFDTPINECGIIAVAVGMGAYGLRPVPEIQFAALPCGEAAQSGCRRIWSVAHDHPFYPKRRACRSPACLSRTCWL